MRVTTWREAPMRPDDPTAAGRQSWVATPFPVPIVSELRYTPASHKLRAGGLLGFIQCVVVGLLRINCSLRRTRDGRLTLSFPVKNDAAGRRHSRAAPANGDAHALLEQAIFEAICLQPPAASSRPKAQGDSGSGGAP